MVYYIFKQDGVQLIILRGGIKGCLDVSIDNMQDWKRMRKWAILKFISNK
jgi:hypothetical protein